MADRKYTFPKVEKLCSEKQIELLFKKGSSIYLFPFKLYYSVGVNSSAEVSFPKILFSVPKKSFKRAVIRNKIKRKLKEAYRLNKASIFCSDKAADFNVNLGLIYIAKENISFPILQEKLILILHRLKNSRQE